MFKNGIIATLLGLLLPGCASTTQTPDWLEEAAKVHQEFHDILNANPQATPESRNFQISNACTILEANPQWASDLNRVHNQWGVRPETLLAMIRQESSFRYDARPIKNGKRLSSAYGFAQALDGTWEHYQQETGLTHHRRDNFAHASYFMGWYIDHINKVNKVSKHDVKNLYYSYHDGPTAASRGSYLKKPWLIKVGVRMERHAADYEKQLDHCLG